MHMRNVDANSHCLMPCHHTAFLLFPAHSSSFHGQRVEFYPKIAASLRNKILVTHKGLTQFSYATANMNPALDGTK